MRLDILIVDGDHGDLLTFLLQTAGYPARHEVDVEKAWMELLQTPVALVVTGYMMPAMDGGQLVSLMRATKALEKTPVLMMTVLREEDVRGKCKFDAFLRRPFTAEALLNQVRIILGPS